MAKLIGNGGSISYGGTAIANVTSYSIETSVADIAFKSIDSNFTSHLGGTKDATFSVECYYDPDNTQHSAVDTDTLADALETGAAIVLTLTDAIATTFTFTGLVTSASRSASVDGPLVMSISGVVDGAITKA